MGILARFVLGLIVGVLAKWIMPGNDPGGLLITIVIGIVGAMIGGFLSSALGMGEVTGINLGSIVIATLGSLILLFGYRRIKG